MSDTNQIQPSVQRPEKKTLRRSFPGGLILGMRGYFRVPGVLTRYKLWHYLLVPAFVSLLLSGLVFAGILWGAESFTGWMDNLVNISIGWLDSLVNWSIRVLAIVALVFGFFFIHKQLVLVALAPFLGRLSELTVRGMEGDKFCASLDAMSAIRRGIRLNLRYIMREVLFTIVLLILGALLFPPVSTVLATVGVFLVQARYLGYGLFDFSLEYRGYRVSESLAWARERRSLATGLGAGYMIFMGIPIIGWMLAPTFGAVAGTIEGMAE